MKINWKKVAGIGIPILAAGIILWYVAKKANPNAGSPGPNANATGKTAPKSKPVPPPKNSAFPLKVGSNNTYVGKLQDILGVTVDNQFGPQTQAALVEQAGLSSVQDEAQLGDIINKILANDAATNKASAGNQLMTTFNKGGYALLGIKTSDWNQVIKDYTGALTLTGTAITMYKGTTYNNADYIIDSVSKLGNLIIQITNGALAGLYSGDPTTMSLVAAAPGVSSTVDDTPLYLGL
jgi:hypothetical protein